jgi:CHASE3 domain sensor protein/nitrogen-specific signal transduction histidine kinase
MKITQFVIYLLSFLSLGILGVLSFLSLNRYSSYVKFSTDVEKTHSVINAIIKLESLLKDAETGNRGFLLTNDTTFLEPYLKAEKKISAMTTDLRQLLSDNEDQERRISYLSILIKEKFELMTLSRSTQLFEHKVDTVSLLEGKKKMDQCRVIVEEMQLSELKLLDERTQTKFFYEANTAKYITRLFIFCGMVFIICCLVIIRDFRMKKNYEEELELKIFELHQSNTELEQIAYIASHDLQEPLRKINTFTDRLLLKHTQNLNEEGKNVISRISYASNRMRGLVEDLANYISLIKVNERRQTVEIKEILKAILVDMEKVIEEKKVQVVWNNLPSIKGYPRQIQLMFKALIDNSIKFSHDQLAPLVHIYGHAASAEEIKFFGLKNASSKYVKITLRDNGIGFDNEFSDRMFKIFQRLHTQYSQYGGKGIGLAIVKRVVSNHNGYVFARGFPQEGAEFTIFFPVQ